MGYSELLVIFLIFLCSYILILRNFRLSLYVLIILGVLLHKELFSFYRWDLLPVRAFMLALFCAAITRVYLTRPSFEKIKAFIKDPFILSLLSLWLVRGISIIFTKNLQASLLLYSFFSTVTVLIMWLYVEFREKPSEVLKYIKFLIYTAFGLTLFGYLQIFLFYEFDFLVGAIWNVPGKLPRIGSLFWDVNHYASLLGSLLPILGVLIIVENKWRTRILYALMFLSMLGGYLLTNSRSGWIIGAVAFIVFVTTSLINKFGIKALGGVLLGMLLLTAPLVYEYSQKDSPFRKQIKESFQYRIDSFDSHFLLLSGTYQIFEAYPVLGGGYGGFFEHFSKTEVGPEYFGRDPAALNTRVPAHTIWGELISETGAAGIVTFGVLIFFLLGVPLYAGKMSQTWKGVAIHFAMASTIIGWFVGGIFYSYNTEFFWLIVSLYFLFSLGNLGKNFKHTELKSLLTNRFIVPIFLFVIAVIMIFGNLGKNSLIPWDEAIYAKIAKNMVVNKDYVSMTWQPQLTWFEKPPLYMWSVAFSMNIVGFTELAARLPSALFGVLSVLVVYSFGKRMFNKSAGYIAALSMLTNVSFIYYSRTSMTDVTTMFFILAAVYFYYILRSSSSSKVAPLVGLFIGLGTMTKGVIGLLPVGIIGIYEIYLLVTGVVSFKSEFKKYLIIFSSTLVVVVPWHLLMAQLYGSAFWQNYLGYHVLDRAVMAIEDKGKPFLWYLEVLKVFMRVWYVVLVPAFGYSLYKLYKKSHKHILLIISVLFIFLFFSSASSKVVWYIMPIYPFAGLMIGKFGDTVLTKWFSRYKLHLLYVGTVAVFTYFVSVSNMAYTGDLTGAQARLMQFKDSFLGTEQLVYLDRIELPLALYYTDGPFEIMDFDISQGRYPKPESSQRLAFVTKKGRFKDAYPGLSYGPAHIQEDGDYVFWYFLSQDEFNSNK